MSCASEGRQRRENEVGYAPSLPNAFRGWMSPPEERWTLRKQDDVSNRNPAARITKIAAREARWPSGKKDGRPGSQKTGREAKKAAGNPQKAFGKLQTGPGILKNRPDGENWGRDEKKSGGELHGRFLEPTEPWDR